MITLGPLDASATTELANLVNQAPLADEVAARLYQESGGRPLFVVERVRAGNMATNSEGEQVLNLELEPFVPQKGTSMDPALPPKVRAVLQARLEQLSPQAAALAQLLASVGRACRVDTLVEASREDEEHVVACLDELWQRHVIQEVGVGVYDFTHDHIRTVAYQAISPARRRLLHRRIAEALQTLYVTNLTPIVAELGFHLEQAGLIEQAVSAYCRAAEAAQRLFAYDEVVNFLERALAALRMHPDSATLPLLEIDLLHELGVARIHTLGWGHTDVEQAWQRATLLARQAGKPEQLCRALLALDSYQRHRGEWQQACVLSAEALALARTHNIDEPFLCHNLLSSYGAALYHTGNPRRAIDLFEEALNLAVQPLQPTFAWLAPQPYLLGLVRSAMCLWMLGYIGQARVRVQRALEMESQHAVQGHTSSASRLAVLDCSALLFSQLRDVSRVHVLGDELILLGTQQDIAYFVRAGQMYVGWALAQRGDVEVGLGLVRRSVAAHHADGLRIFEPTWGALLAELLALSGSNEQALQAVDEALVYAAQSHHRYWNAYLLTQKGDFLHALAAPTVEVEQSYQQALDVAHQQGAPVLQLGAALRLSHLWLQQGRDEDVCSLLSGVLACIPQECTMPDLVAAQTLLANLRA